MKNTELYNENHEATYCPEDNKLRLYVGRVPREEFLALRNEGWKRTPKQDCDFVATWTATRENTALSYAGIIGDDDQSPQERAADRAERFARYRDKRTSEALGHAATYESQPSAHGYQSAKKAERAAARHDRHGTRAINQWDKATYWTHRTEGVISNALYLSAPSVRLGRIRKIEKSQRESKKTLEQFKKNYVIVTALKNWHEESPLKTSFMEKVNTEEMSTEQARLEAARHYLGAIAYSYYMHPAPETTEKPEFYAKNSMSLWSLLTMEKGAISVDQACDLWLENTIDPESDAFQESNFMRWSRHYQNRLDYENQMIEAAGGSAAEVEMKIGDLVEGHAVMKINKSNASGKITSVRVILMTEGRERYRSFWKNGNIYYNGIGDLADIKLTRSLADCHQPATAESLAALENYKLEQSELKKSKPKPPALINPTPEDAQKLQDKWNQHASKTRTYQKNDSEVVEMTMEQYKARSAGGSNTYCTAQMNAHGLAVSTRYGTPTQDTCFKIRTTSAGTGLYDADSVIIITDKPQKKLPAEIWEEPKAEPVEKPETSTPAHHQ